MKTKTKHLLPIEIKLPERVSLECGAVFVTLRTLDELEQFWTSSKGQFKYACEGINLVNGNTCLHSYEWVFGTSKSAVVRTVMRWGQSGIDCIFHHYKPDQFEIMCLSEAKRALPHSYQGSWGFSNVPDGLMTCEEWYQDFGHEELSDPDMPFPEVINRLCEYTFDVWVEQPYPWEINAYDQNGVLETIRYWLEEKAAGARYYGDENEHPTKSKA